MKENSNNFAVNVSDFADKCNPEDVKAFYKTIALKIENLIHDLEQRNKQLTGEFGDISIAKNKKFDAMFNINPENINDKEKRQKHSKVYIATLLDYETDVIIPLYNELEENIEKIKALKSLFAEISETSLHNNPKNKQ